MPPYSPTPSELAVLEELCSDTSPTNKEIAARLGLSPHTVADRLKLLMRSTGCRNRTALALWWTRGGVIEDGEK